MRRLGTVIVLITQMGVAALADHIHAFGFIGGIDVGADVFLGDGRRESSESGFGVKFGLRAEQRASAAEASVEAGIVQVKIGAVKSQIAGSLARNVKLLQREQFAPVRLRVIDLL